MPQSGGPVEQDVPKPNLDHEKKDETFEARLARIQASFLCVRTKFAALCQRVEQKGNNVNENDLLEVRATKDELGKLDREMDTLKNEVAASVMRTGEYPINPNLNLPSEQFNRGHYIQAYTIHMYVWGSLKRVKFQNDLLITMLYDSLDTINLKYWVRVNFQFCSRGMSKQIMLDWLRINHPQVPIKCGSTKTEVAKIVREVQPQYFPDPASDTPAIDPTAGTFSPGSLISSVSSIPLPPEDKPSVPLTPSITFSPPPPRSETVAKIGAQKKRSATNELDHERLFKRSEPGHSITSIPEESSLLKKEKRHSKSGKLQRHMLNGVSHNRTNQGKVVSKSDPVAVGIQASESPQNRMPPLIDTSKKAVSKSIPTAVEPQVSKNHTNDIPPLIDLSETNWMDTPNPVVGQDIPPIEIPLQFVSGKTCNKRSGVDVFQEERNRAQQIRELEEAVEHLRLKLEMNEKSDLTVLADEMRRDEEVRLLQVCVKQLEQKVGDFESLEATVTNLQSEVTHLRKDLTAAAEDIRGHEDVIARLISMDDGDELSSAAGSSAAGLITFEIPQKIVLHLAPLIQGRDSIYLMIALSQL
ncbi:uncharacterized protein MELLADRAFT_92930 [Melampsora larici-populina 98AG31]|uniref:Uncharacterized protein n=1 Tax=Melampsora larici-populina (strain 98AG31 / pathotype 3-4-7) TaxID=747676 RepID=F4S3A3_MELLP|nr:uncharacterized protein MELLADRAFT_92930 [Melampsora larici-populina 98AG31]EGG00782.1 hypothetical protein MELLADRAFT_92930 [Melampsora larici-populina 98AG31]